MRKVIFILSVCLLLIICWKPYIYCLEIYYPTKEELGGNISIPNRKGGTDEYIEIDTYEKLYSVLEDLGVEYRQLLEEYKSLESNYEELKKELANKEEEMKYLEEQSKTIGNNETDYWVSFFFILGIAIYVSYNIGLYKNK